MTAKQKLNVDYPTFLLIKRNVNNKSKDEQKNSSSKVIYVRLKCICLSNNILLLLHMLKSCSCHIDSVKLTFLQVPNFQVTVKWYILSNVVTSNINKLTEDIPRQASNKIINCKPVIFHSTDTSLASTWQVLTSGHIETKPDFY